MVAAPLTRGWTQAEAAEVGADAALAGAVALAPGIARRHAELAPDGRELVLGNTHEINALAAGKLHQWHLVLLGDIGDAYPDTDPQWKGADSRLFLEGTLAKLAELGWKVAGSTPNRR